MQPKGHNLHWQRLPGHRNLKGRAGHTATIVGRKIFVLGGRNGNEFFNDVWTFNIDTEQWKQMQQHAIFSPRAYHTATLVKGHELWLIGGSDQCTMYGDVYVLNTDSLKWSTPALRGHVAGKLRGTHAAVLHPLKQHSILVHGGYGGVDSHWLNDLVVLDTDSLEWVELKPVGIIPSARGYHTMVAVDTSVILFGGKGEAGIIKTDTLSTYDVANNMWIIPKVSGEIPSPRSNHAAALLEEHQVVVHGGRHGSIRLSDTCVLQVPLIFPTIASDPFTWHSFSQAKSSPYKATGRRATSTTKLDGPGGRAAHSLVVKDRALFVFGGYGGQGLTFADIYALRQFPHVQGCKERMQGRYLRKSSTRGLERFLEDTEESDESLEGWRNTKKLRKDFDNKPTAAVEQDVSIIPDDVHEVLQQGSVHKVILSSIKQLPDHGKDGDGVTLGAEVGVLKKTSCIIDKELYEMLAHEKELFKKELLAAQQTIEVLKTSLKEKAASEVSWERSRVELSKEIEKTKKEKGDLEHELSILQHQFEARKTKVQMLENEVDKLNTNVQTLSSALELKLKENAEIVQKMKSTEVKLEETSCMLEETKDLCAEAASERDDYKSCVQKLELELEKQMQTLQLANIKYESEKKILFQENAERKNTADRLFTELGIHKESARSMQETVERQAKEFEQICLKVEKLQKEKEELTRSNGSISAECRQLIAAREATEAKLKLVNAELDSVHTLIGRNDAEFERLKESTEQSKSHITELHTSLKKNEEDLKVQLEENDRLKSLVREVEDFEQAQARLLLGHVEKLRCARQQCPG